MTSHNIFITEQYVECIRVTGCEGLFHNTVILEKKKFAYEIDKAKLKYDILDCAVVLWLWHEWLAHADICCFQEILQMCT